jgi:hypothetical protein
VISLAYFYFFQNEESRLKIIFERKSPWPILSLSVQEFEDNKMVVAAVVKCSLSPLT